MFDYFLKDHLGNTRSVITDELQQDKYPVASLEPAKAGTEQGYYDIKTAQVVGKSEATGIPNYTNDNGIGNNPTDANFSATNSTQLYKLNSNTAKTGLGITLKVMAGDKLDVFGKSYYFQNTNGTGGNSNIPVLDLLTAFLGAPGAGAATSTHGAVTATGINTALGVAGINSMQSSQTAQNNAAPSKPKAFINVIFFDEQFKAVDYRVSAIGAAGAVKDHYADLQNLTANKSGYVYIYCSNESPVNVFFDNLQVVHTRGALLEENTFYPFGLKIAGISSSKLPNNTPNKYLFNGKELQSNEFSDGSGLELYDYHARMYDSQIGRFFALDKHAGTYDMFSPYTYVLNNPLRFIDPDGKDIRLGDMSNEDRKIILTGLQQLTGDKIAYNKKTGNIDIVSRISDKKNQLKSGTALIRALVDNTRFTATINYNSNTTESGTIPENKINAGNGTGSNATVDIGPNNPRVQVSTSFNEPSRSESQPLYLVIGEELSHALADFDGVRAKDNETGVMTYRGPDGRGHYEKQPLEELYNHGIGIYKRPGTDKRSEYPSENSLRKEHGLPIRVAYDIVPGASGDHNY